MPTCTPASPCTLGQLCGTYSTGTRRRTGTRSSGAPHTSYIWNACHAVPVDRQAAQAKCRSARNDGRCMPARPLREWRARQVKEPFGLVQYMLRHGEKCCVHIYSIRYCSPRRKRESATGRPVSGNTRQARTGAWVSKEGAHKACILSALWPPEAIRSLGQSQSCVHLVVSAFPRHCRGKAACLVPAGRGET